MSRRPVARQLTRSLRKPDPDPMSRVSAKREPAEEVMLKQELCDSKETVLDVVVQMELVWMRAQPDRIDLFLPLVVEPGLDHVAGEHIAAE